MPESEKTLKLYISWAKESQDDKLATQLKKHLAMLERRKLIAVWDEIEAGFDVNKEETRRIIDVADDLSGNDRVDEIKNAPF